MKSVVTALAWGALLVGMLETNTASAGTSVIAHRGASAYAPENTVASFRLAHEKGAPWFELDCTLSKDNAVVVIHDDTLERTTDLAGRVDAHTLAELRKTEAGAWFGEAFKGELLPTLGDALDFAKGKIGVYIEIKDSADDDAVMATILAPAEAPDRAAMLRLIEESGSRNLDLARRVVREVRSRRMECEVVIQSFSPVVCAAVLAEAPDLRTELLASSDKDKPSQWPWFLRWLKVLDPHGFNVNKIDVTKELIADLHARGKTIAAWTVNDEEDMRRLAGLGVDFLITDKPDLALSVLKDMAK